MKITNIDMPKQAFIYAAIHMLSNRLQTLGDKIDPTITSKQWFVLAAVSKFTQAPPNIGDIASVLGTSRQNIKKIANILQKQGLLMLQKNKSDQRSIQLILTEQCYVYFKSRQQQEEDYIQNIFSGIDEQTLTTLCGGMSQLIDNIDKLKALEDE